MSNNTRIINRIETEKPMPSTKTRREELLALAENCNRWAAECRAVAEARRKLAIEPSACGLRRSLERLALAADERGDRYREREAEARDTAARCAS